MSKALAAIEKYNLKLSEEELATILEYERRENGGEWLVNVMGKYNISLLQALSSYHSDWSNAQGNQGW